jgi:acyl-CoA oxidase
MKLRRISNELFEQFPKKPQAIEDKKSKEIMNFMSIQASSSQNGKIKDGIRRWLYEAAKTKAIRKMVYFAGEIRPDAVLLVKAFDIPDSCLAV